MLQHWFLVCLYPFLHSVWNQWRGMCFFFLLNHKQNCRTIFFCHWRNHFKFTPDIKDKILTSQCRMINIWRLASVLRWHILLQCYSVLYSENISPVGLVKFFGNLAITDSPQQVCETYPAFQNKVFEMALDPDPVMIGVALDTLGLLGSTVEGKQVLQKTG